MAMMQPSEKGIEIVSERIAKAWLANAERVYPEDAAEPDPGAMADVAARAAWAVFTEWIENSRKATKAR